MYTPALFLFLYVVFVFYGLIKDKKNFIKLADDGSNYHWEAVA